LRLHSAPQGFGNDAAVPCSGAGPFRNDLRAQPELIDRALALFERVLRQVRG
jgi:hypothetical protein